MYAYMCTHVLNVCAHLYIPCCSANRACTVGFLRRVKTVRRVASEARAVVGRGLRSALSLRRSGSFHVHRATLLVFPWPHDALAVARPLSQYASLGRRPAALKRPEDALLSIFSWSNCVVCSRTASIPLSFDSRNLERAQQRYGTFMSVAEVLGISSVLNLLGPAM